jgi:hypothetical protein
LIDRESSIAWLRERRVTFGFLDLDLGFQTTIFLGLHEGQPYLRDRLREVQNQTIQSFYLLIVDNFSEDFDRSLIEAEINSLGMEQGRWLVVRNPVNLGGLGSFQLNLDLVPTEWVTSMHQDDSYLSHHINVHLEAIQQLNSDTLSVSSDLGSLGPNGSRMPALPRANWFLQNPTRIDLFLANVGMQVVPYPSLSLRKNVVEQDLVPWTSTSFSDSELTLRNLMLGAHMFIQEETVLYRENPNSESHVQGIEVRNHGAVMGLLRIFGSTDFNGFIADLEPERRAAFTAKLQQGIRLRISDSNAADVVSALALEQLAHTWGYSVPNTNEEISKVILGKGQRYSAELLQGLNHLINENQPSDGIEPKSALPANLGNDTRVLDENENKSRKRFSSAAAMRGLAIAILGALPYHLRRRVYKVIILIYSKLRPGNKWDFNW